MRVKAALGRKGATEWQDYYEPGEGVSGALANLEASKGQSAATGASIGVGGQRTDDEEISGMARRQGQAERAQAGQVRGAKDPALIEADPAAIGFLREEQQFDPDVFDLSFNGKPSGRDYERLQERHERRSQRAQTVDEQSAATVTRDPLKWTEAPDRYDYPGIDELDPRKRHAARSKMARRVDEQRAAPFADSVEQWARDPDQYDWLGVDSTGMGDAGFGFDELRFDLADDFALEDIARL
jgi:hypothetical protein